MSRAMRIPAATLIATVALVFLAAPAHAGPPWISIELPANPLHPSSRGALFLVHSFHHGTPVEHPVTCRAEGLVEGTRRTVDLAVNETNRTGVRAVRGDVPEGGTWMIVCVSRDGEARATALLDLDGAHQIARVRVPHRAAEGGRWMIPTDVSAREIDAMLRARATEAAAPAELAGLLLLLLLPAGWLAVRKR